MFGIICQGERQSFFTDDKFSLYYIKDKVSIVMSSFFISLVLLDRHARTCYNKVSASYARALWNFNGSVQGSSCRLRKGLRSSFDFFNPKQEVHFQSTFSKQNSIRNQFILFAWSNQKPRSHGTTTSYGLGAFLFIHFRVM